MSNAEHAIENAVNAIERARQGEVAYDEAYVTWKRTDPNLEWLEAKPSEIWAMAMWVVFNRGGEQG